MLTVRAFSYSKQLTLTAAFATLCCIGTLVITIPLPTGYFNVGDVFVLLAGWFLGPLYGSIAAALGSALADVISGFAIYAPATFFIKGGIALLAWFLYRVGKRVLSANGWDFIPRAFAAIFAESFMVGGYFLWELMLYGFGGATVAVIGNVLQGVCCGVCAIAVVTALYPVKFVQSVFPLLKTNRSKEKKPAKPKP